MKHKFTMYVLNVYENKHKEGEWRMERNDFEAELLNEGTYNERYDADEFMVALKPYTLRQHLPMTRDQMLMTRSMDHYLDKPLATLEPDGVTVTILFRGEPHRTEGECLNLLRGKLEDTLTRDNNGARTQLDTANRRMDLAEKRDYIAYTAFRD